MRFASRFVLAVKSVENLGSNLGAHSLSVVFNLDVISGTANIKRNLYFATPLAISHGVGDKILQHAFDIFRVYPYVSFGNF